MTKMGTPSTIRQSNQPDTAIVAFDFDGTLTIRDSFTEFLRWRAGKRAWALGLAKMTPAVATYARTRDRGRIKAASVKVFLKGVPRAELEADAARFRDAIWDRFMRPDALKAWDEWGRKNAHRVIVTASPDIVVRPFAERLGAEALLGTPLVFDAEDRVTGRFASANCRAEEKVRRLRETYGTDVRLAAAYGDTSGDTEMLAIADQPGFRVFTAHPPAS